MSFACIYDYPEVTEAQRCVASSNSELAVLSVMPNAKLLGNMLVLSEWGLLEIAIMYMFCSHVDRSA